MKHPLSTVFNLSFGVAGIFMSAWYVGVAAGLLMLASIGYHWKDTRWWRHMDIISIYGMFFVLLGWQWSTFMGHEWFLLACMVGLTATVWYTYDDWSHKQIGLLALLNLMVLYTRVDLLQFGLATGLFLLALAIGQKAETYSKHTKQYDRLHAVWHLLAAIAILFTAI